MEFETGDNLPVCVSLRDLQREAYGLSYDFENEAPETRRWRLALNSLTPGGSEYVDDPERCVQAVREGQAMEHKAMLMYARRAHDAERELRILTKE